MRGDSGEGAGRLGGGLGLSVGDGRVADRDNNTVAETRAEVAAAEKAAKGSEWGADGLKPTEMQRMHIRHQSEDLPTYYNVAASLRAHAMPDDARAILSSMRSGGSSNPSSCTDARTLGFRPTVAFVTFATQVGSFA